MSGRRRVTITESDTIIIGRGWRLGDLVKDAGLKATYSASAGGFMLDRDRLPDLLAYLESRNVGVTLTQPGSEA
jgi:hypothetical protein